MSSWNFNFLQKILAQRGNARAEEGGVGKVPSAPPPDPIGFIHDTSPLNVSPWTFTPPKKKIYPFPLDSFFLCPCHAVMKIAQKRLKLF